MAKNKKIRILLCDEHPILRTGLRKLLSLEEGFSVVGEADNCQSAVELAGELKADVVVMDPLVNGLSGMEVLREFQQKHKKTKVVVLTASDKEDTFVEVMRLGAAGILRKNVSIEMLVKCIRKVESGEIWLDTRMTAAVVKEFSGPSPSARRERDSSPLSTREKQVVGLVAQGFKNKEIAERMFISEQTVKNHLHNIFDKLGVSDRLELALWVIHKNIQIPQ